MSEHQDYDGIRYRDETSSPGIFRWLFILLAVWGVLFIGYFLFGGWSSKSEAESALKAREDQKKAAHNAAERYLDKNNQGTGVGSGDKIQAYIAVGKQVYGRLCAACHGENGKGGVGPDLTSSKYKYGKTRIDVAKSITDGRPNGMPGFSGQVDSEQVEGLVEYLLSLK